MKQLQNRIDCIKGVLERRGAVSVGPSPVITYQDGIVFLEMDLGSDRLWFSTWDGNDWEVVIDIARDGTTETLALYIQSDEVDWAIYLQDLLDSSEDWPTTNRANASLTTDLKEIGIDPHEFSTAIAHLEALIDLGVASLSPIRTLLRHLQIPA